jgi:hypothetical protein
MASCRLIEILIANSFLVATTTCQFVNHRIVATWLRGIDTEQVPLLAGYICAGRSDAFVSFALFGASLLKTHIGSVEKVCWSEFQSGRAPGIGRRRRFPSIDSH